MNLDWVLDQQEKTAIKGDRRQLMKPELGLDIRWYNEIIAIYKYYNSSMKYRRMSSSSEDVNSST